MIKINQGEQIEVNLSFKPKIKKNKGTAFTFIPRKAFF